MAGGEGLPFGLAERGWSTAWRLRRRLQRSQEGEESRKIFLLRNDDSDRVFSLLPPGSALLRSQASTRAGMPVVLSYRLRTSVHHHALSEVLARWRMRKEGPASCVVDEKSLSMIERMAGWLEELQKFLTEVSSHRDFIDRDLSGIFVRLELKYREILLCRCRDHQLLMCTMEDEEIRTAVIALNMDACRIELHGSSQTHVIATLEQALDLFHVRKRQKASPLLLKAKRKEGPRWSAGVEDSVGCYSIEAVADELSSAMSVRDDERMQSLLKGMRGSSVLLDQAGLAELFDERMQGMLSHILVEYETDADTETDVIAILRALLESTLDMASSFGPKLIAKLELVEDHETNLRRALKRIDGLLQHSLPLRKFFLKNDEFQSLMCRLHHRFSCANGFKAAFLDEFQDADSWRGRDEGLLDIECRRIEENEDEDLRHGVKTREYSSATALSYLSDSRDVALMSPKSSCALSHPELRNGGPETAASPTCIPKLKLVGLSALDSPMRSSTRSSRRQVALPHVAIHLESPQAAAESSSRRSTQVRAMTAGELDSSRLSSFDRRSAMDELDLVARNVSRYYIATDMAAMSCQRPAPANFPGEAPNEETTRVGWEREQANHAESSEEGRRRGGGGESNLCSVIVHLVNVLSKDEVTSDWMEQHINLLFLEFSHCFQHPEPADSFETLCEALKTYQTVTERRLLEFSSLLGSYGDLSKVGNETLMMINKFDLFVYRLRDQLAHVADSSSVFNTASLAITLKMLSSYIDLRSSHLIKMHVVFLCMESLLKVKFLLMANSALMADVNILYLLAFHAWLELMDALVEHLLEDNFQSLWFSVVVEDEAFCDVVQEYSKTVCSEEPLGLDFKGYERFFAAGGAMEGSRAVEALKLEVLKHYRLCMRLLNVKFDLKGPLESPHHDQAVSFDVLCSRFEFLLSAKSGIALQTLPPTPLQEEMALVREVFSLLITCFESGVMQTFMPRALVDDYVGFHFLGFLRFSQTVTGDAIAKEMSRLHLQALIQLSSSPTASIKQRLTALRVVNWISLQLDLEYENSQQVGVEVATEGGTEGGRASPPPAKGSSAKTSDRKIRRGLSGQKASTSKLTAKGTRSLDEPRGIRNDENTSCNSKMKKSSKKKLDFNQEDSSLSKDSIRLPIKPNRNKSDREALKHKNTAQQLNRNTQTTQANERQQDDLSKTTETKPTKN
eukprot:752020-Hanusia_phi.AAC.1